MGIGSVADLTSIQFLVPESIFMRQCDVTANPIWVSRRVWLQIGDITSGFDCHEEFSARSRNEVCNSALECLSVDNIISVRILVLKMFERTSYATCEPPFESHQILGFNGGT